jgi:hypothetical protein
MQTGLILALSSPPDLMKGFNCCIRPPTGIGWPGYLWQVPKRWMGTFCRYQSTGTKDLLIDQKGAGMDFEHTNTCRSQPVGSLTAV